MAPSWRRRTVTSTSRGLPITSGGSLADLVAGFLLLFVLVLCIALVKSQGG